MWKDKGNSLRLGIIGFGNRGEELLRLLHLTNPDLADLNIEIRGVCEVFNLRLEWGLATAGAHSKGYLNYLDLLLPGREKGKMGS